MKSFVMLAATLVVLAGSNSFAAKEVGVPSGPVSSNCDPQDPRTNCHNDAAAVDCPYHTGGKLTDHHAGPHSDSGQTAAANTEKTVR